MGCADARCAARGRNGGGRRAGSRRAAGRGCAAARRRQLAATELRGGDAPLPCVLAARRSGRAGAPPSRARRPRSNARGARTEAGGRARSGPGRRRGGGRFRGRTRGHRGRPVHGRLEWRTQGGAAHAPRARPQVPDDGRRARAASLRRRADARATRPHLGPAQRRARTGRGRDAHGADGAVGSGARADADRAGARELHDRTTDVLRRAHERARVLARASRVAAADLVGRSGGEHGLRRTGGAGARCAREALVRIDRGADDHHVDRGRPGRRGRRRPTGGWSARPSCGSRPTAS